MLGLPILHGLADLQACSNKPAGFLKPSKFLASYNTVKLISN